MNIIMIPAWLAKMKTIIVLFLLLANAGVYAQSDSLARTLHRIIVGESNRNNFSGNVIVLENTDFVVAQSAGFADRKQEIENKPTTKFVIASVGKLFTKIVILQLVSEGKLSLNDLVSKYYGNFDRSPHNQIAIDHLLNHSSGLRDVYVNRAYVDLVKSDEPGFQNKVVDLISAENLYFLPGSDYKYSNSGYYLLGAIASKIDEKTLEDVISDRIFSPLAMSNSGFSRSGEYIDNHAIPYEFKWFGMIIKEKKLDLKGDSPSGAGGQYSTVQDLARVYSSLVNDELLLTDTFKGILFGNSDLQNWKDIRNSGRIVGYVGGDTRGWSAKIGFYFLKEKTYGVIITSNFDNMAHELDLQLRNYIKEASER